MNFLYMAHSGIRYLVLLAGVIAFVVLLRGLLSGAPYGRSARISTAAFSGFLNLQFLLGLAMVLMGRWYAALMGHLVLMVLAVAAAQLMSSWAKRNPEPRQAHRLALAGVGLALVLIVAGVAAIGRHPLENQAFVPLVD